MDELFCLGVTSLVHKNAQNEEADARYALPWTGQRSLRGASRIRSESREPTIWVVRLGLSDATTSL